MRDEPDKPALQRCTDSKCRFFTELHVGPISDGGKPHIYRCDVADCRFFTDFHVTDPAWWGKDETRPHVTRCSEATCHFSTKQHLSDRTWWGKDEARPHVVKCKEVNCRFFNEDHVGPPEWYGHDGCKAHVLSLGRSPESEVRRILSAAWGGGELPETRNLRVYYIRGVDDLSGSGDVVYPPEFLYVLDVGFAAFPAVVLAFRARGAGDPEFPNYAEHRVFSVLSFEEGDVLSPITPGDLSVGVRPGTTEEDVRAALGPYVLSVEKLDAERYAAKVRAFDEPACRLQILNNVAFVTYVEFNVLIRTDQVAWRVDQAF